MSPARRLTWDCACGSGQATIALAERFEHVIATDASAGQLEHAPQDARVEWRVALAESSGLVPHSADLITVAQALHWFDLPKFWSEVRRVARVHGVIAAWSYGVVSVDDAPLTTMLRDFHDGIVGPYWPIERGHVDRGYHTLDFPFRRLTPPAIDLEADWSLAEFTGYLRTWSATRRYIAALGHDPVDAFEEELAPRWGASRHVRWPLTILAGVVDGN